MDRRAERLNYSASELATIRVSLAVLTGSDGCSEARMVRDLEWRSRY